MKVLVVTPTLGESRWLDATVASVARFNDLCRHVLVAPLPAIGALETRFPQCVVVAEPAGRKGMYAAINAGAALPLPWDAFTYLNDDDLLLPHFAAGVPLAETAVQARRPLVVYGGVRLVDAEGRRLGAIPVSPHPSLNRALYAQRLEPVFQHGTLVTRSAFAQLGGFDETFRLCGDSEFLARACVSGIPFARVGGEAVAAFRLRAGQLTKGRAAMDEERRRVDDKLRLLDLPPTSNLRRARWIFRMANLGIYAERIARHGFISFDELLACVGK
ncbi:MAG: hypothetical protein JWM35_55 [Verrucomicrobia bacterium]|nr:hypothetical protein [Verrucomicrobiota bacterium]